MVTVKELMEILKDLPQEAVVMVASDPECNQIRELTEAIGVGKYDKSANYNEKYTDDADVEYYKDEGDYYEDLPPAILIGP